MIFTDSVQNIKLVLASKIECDADFIMEHTALSVCVFLFSFEYNKKREAKRCHPSNRPTNQRASQSANTPTAQLPSILPL